MKYINQAAAQMLDEKDIAKEELWHLLYSKHSTKASFSKYIDCMAASGRNTERIEKLTDVCVRELGSYQENSKKQA